jgi:diaminohydroxyphosphoribosylaminopyrimidine deaminase/5-amino-6-(5-phosphoribosylamino)uracil reductase
MARALQLARRGLYTTQPNPRVGCVIVKDGVVVGEGFHARAGEPHAEVYALRQASGQAQGATAYVTLEPCAHHGRTPPCADALVQAGVARVVVATQDLNPLVAGQGLAKLHAAGIETSTGVLENEARALNAGFLRRIGGGLPWVRMKLAMSLDGRTAMASGESKWITGPAARLDVQRLRAQSGAIVTGVGTVLADDPAMTVRVADWPDWPEGVEPVQPLRVVVDSRLQTPPTAQIVAGAGRTVMATVAGDGASADALRRAGADIWLLAEEGGRVDLHALLEKLRDAQVNDVLVEAGPVLAAAFVEAGLVDELIVYQAPTLLGSAARPLLALPLSRMAEQKRLNVLDVRMVGEDVRWTCTLQPASD